ncbi:hypothetical protein FRC20_007314, partial [Serendipita sp. 405]
MSVNGLRTNLLELRVTIISKLDGIRVKSAGKGGGELLTDERKQCGWIAEGEEIE